MLIDVSFDATSRRSSRSIRQSLLLTISVENQWKIGRKSPSNVVCHRFRHRKLMQKPAKIDRFFMVLGGQKPPRSTPGGPGSPGGSQVGPRRVPREPRAQDPPRAPLERPKVAQGSPKGRPKSPRSSQKHPQEGKMEAETLPRSILKPNLVQNHIRKRFSIDFSWMFHQNR